MPVNDNIRVVEYNTIQTRISRILGATSGGTPDFGYGQTVQSSQVTTADRVTVNEWGNLRFDIINVYTHQVGSAPNTVVLPDIAEGGTIRYSVTDAPINVWDILSSTLETNRFNLSGLQAITTNIGPYNLNASWINQATWEGRMLFSNSTNATHFFNSGGKITFNSTFSPSNTVSPKAQETSWQNLLASVGDVTWGGATPETGTSPDNAKNFHKLTSSYQAFYSVSASSPYGANNYNIDARTEGGNLADLRFRIRYVDSYTDPALAEPFYPPADGVSGNLLINIVLTIPSQTLQPPALSQTWQVQTPIISQLAFSAS